MSELSPQQLLAARAIDVLTSLSEQRLRQIRAGVDPITSRTGWSAQVPAHTLTALANALETAHPGVLDRTLGKIRLAAGKPECPTCGHRLDPVDDQWRCGGCGDEFHPETIAAGAEQ